MNMKLSNTLLISEELMPNYNKAFTLAEVLITLTILGVVAAITIPSLINRQSEVAAKTKLKKAIANYENVAAIFMAEHELDDLATHGDVTGLQGDYENYFKVVENENGAAGFKTSDGAYWAIAESGDAIVCDASAAPKFCVRLWAKEGRVNDDGEDYAYTEDEMPDLPDGVDIEDDDVYDADDFMNEFTSNQ